MKDNRDHYIYKHIRLDTNEVFYVGVGSNKKKSIYYRAHRKDGRNSLWTNIVNKVSYRIEILVENITKEEAWAKEIELIAYYKRRCDGGTLANLSLGGGGPLGVQSIPNRVTKPNRRNTGKKLSEAHKQRLREFNLGRKTSPETKEKLRQINLGLVFKEETKAKLRQNSACARPVLNVYTGVCYASIPEAQQAHPHYNINTLRQKLSGRKTNNTPLRLIDNKALTQDLKTNCKLDLHSRAKKVRDLNTGIIYNSKNKYATEHRISPSKLKRLRRDKLIILEEICT